MHASRPRRPARRAVALAPALAALVLTLAAGGCGSDDPDGPDGPEAPPSSPASPPTTSTSTPPEPGTEPQPEVAPATGPRLELAGIALHAPEGWRRAATQTISFAAANGEGSNLNISQLPSLDLEPDLDALARTTMRTDSLRGGGRLDDVEVGGVTLAHLRAVEDSGDENHVLTGYAGADGGEVVAIILGLDPRVRDRADEILASVLASVEWRAADVELPGD